MGSIRQRQPFISEKEALISEQMNGNSYDALVVTMGGALERLSCDISGGIMSVLRQEPTR